MKPQRNQWLIVLFGVLALIGVLGAGVAAYWQYANNLPDYTPPGVTMPVPNAYDDFVAASRMCREAGGAAVRPAAAGARTSDTLLAYETTVPIDQVRAVVARNRPALARLRQGFRKEYRSPPVVSSAQLFPELSDYRELARVLVTEGKLAEREGRMADAARSYLDCLRLGIEAPRGGPLIHGLVGIAIQSIGLRPLQGLVERLDGPTAARTAREMARLERNAPSLADTLAAEKESMTATMLEILRRPERLGQMIGAGAPSAPTPPSAGETMLARLVFGFIPKRPIMDGMRGYMDALIANARRPSYAQAPRPPLPRDPLNRVVLPVFNDAAPKWTQRDAQWRTTMLRLAVRAYQQDYGLPPTTLAALVPAYLPAVPQDPFAPKSLVYRRTADGPLIYSRGPDGDDDGGKDLGLRVQPRSEGDMVSMKSPRRQ